MSNGITGAWVRQEISKRIDEMRITQMDRRGLPNSRFMALFKCIYCKYVCGSRPFNFHGTRMGFVCPGCITSENYPFLVMIPKCFVRDLPFPCKFGRFGCQEYCAFDSDWNQHVSRCVYKWFSVVNVIDDEDEEDSRSDVSV